MNGSPLPIQRIYHKIQIYTIGVTSHMPHRYYLYITCIYNIVGFHVITCYFVLHLEEESPNSVEKFLVTSLE